MEKTITCKPSSQLPINLPFFDTKNDGLLFYNVYKFLFE